MKKIILSSVLVLSVIFMCLAAQVDGVWKGKLEGQYDITLNLKSEGAKLTGTISVADNNPVSENPGDTSYSPFVSAQMGENTITDGKVEGNDVSFTGTFNGTVIPYTGKIDGDKISLVAKFKKQDIKTTLTKAK